MSDVKPGSACNTEKSFHSRVLCRRNTEGWKGFIARRAVRLTLRHVLRGT